MASASVSVGACRAALAPGAARQAAAEPATSLALDTPGLASQSRLRIQWVAPRTRPERAFSRQVAMQDSMADMDADDISALLASDASQALPQSEYPPGMVRYESMVVLRPDVTDEERLAFTQRYEEVRAPPYPGPLREGRAPHYLGSLACDRLLVARCQPGARVKCLKYNANPEPSATADTGSVESHAYRARP